MLLTCALAQDAPKTSLEHFQLAQHHAQQHHWVDAVNEFRSALRGDRQPPWIIVWSHLEIGKIFDTTNQRERALNEYRRAAQTRDNTRNAQQEIAKYRETPYQASAIP